MYCSLCMANVCMFAFLKWILVRLISLLTCVFLFAAFFYMFNKVKIPGNWPISSEYTEDLWSKSKSRFNRTDHNISLLGCMRINPLISTRAQIRYEGSNPVISENSFEPCLIYWLDRLFNLWIVVVFDSIKCLEYFKCNSKWILS